MKRTLLDKSKNDSAETVCRGRMPCRISEFCRAFCYQTFWRDIVSGNQFLILFCISSTDGNCLLRSSGRQLVSFLNIPIAHGAVRKLIQENHSVSPRNLCNSLLHKCLIRISFREFCHVLRLRTEYPLTFGKEMRISAARFSMNLLPNVLRSFIT